MVASSPRWDLTPFFPSISSPEFAASFKKLGEELVAFEAIVDACTVAGDSSGFSKLLNAFNALLENMHLIRAYVECTVSIDSNDTVAQARESELDGLTCRLQALNTRITTWIGTLSIEELVATNPEAKAHEFYLRKTKLQATKLMSPAEEALFSKLSPTGGVAWAKLHGNATSQIVVKVALPVGDEFLPMSGVRNLAYDNDRGVRKTAYEAELAAWKANEVPCAAATNSIKGEVGILAELRGWSSPLEPSLEQNNIDKPTLDALLSAARETFPEFRRYLRAKAKLLGQEKLAWFDLFAPVGASKQEWTYEAATNFVEKHFRNYSDKMADFALRAFAEQWVDAEPRLGKRDGAYCEGFGGDISRIMMNFKPSFGSVSTLAHELGHGYHNVCLAGKTYIQQDSPSTVAETASIFCETILKRAALKEVPDSERLAILEGALQGSCQVVVDITSRYLYETAIFAARKDREQSAAELCEMMVNAQRETYGDGLDNDYLHPYMWAAKPHYFSPNSSFYNYPYMFGQLFSLGLYAIYEKDREGFKARYDNLLSNTGAKDAATLAAEFGIDIRSADFWRGSLAIIKQDIDAFVELVG